MAGSLTSYMLRLNSDPHERKKFSESEASARRAMTEAGVSEAHQDLLLKGRSVEITEALMKECSAEPGAQQATIFSVCFKVTRPTA